LVPAVSGADTGADRSNLAIPAGVIGETVRQIFPVGNRLGSADPLSAAGTITPATAAVDELIAALASIYPYPE